jgi:hypothetical protein
MYRYVLAVIPAAMLSTGCGNEPRLDTRTFELKYLRGGEAERMVGPYVYIDRPTAKGMISYTDGTLTVRETPDNLDRIARVLAQYDRPLPLVRLTFHLIQADGAATSDPAIADVEASLRQLFRFRGYRLVQQGVFSANEGGEVTQQLGSGDYTIAAEIRRVSGNGDSAVVEMRVHLNGRNVRFATDVGVPVGKTAVLGNVGEDPHGTLILTVQPQLINPNHR